MRGVGRWVIGRGVARGESSVRMRVARRHVKTINGSTFDCQNISVEILISEVRGQKLEVRPAFATPSCYGAARPAFATPSCYGAAMGWGLNEDQNGTGRNFCRARGRGRGERRREGSR